MTKPLTIAARRNFADDENTLLVLKKVDLSHLKQLDEADVKDHHLRLCVVDTETTGLDPKKDEVIELAYRILVYDKNHGYCEGVLHSYHGYQDTETSISPIAQKVHGITKDLLEGQEFNRKLIRTHLADVDYFVAHNADFDKSFVEKLFNVKAPWLCSLSDLAWEGLSNKRLDYLVMVIGQRWFDPHNAKDDVDALVSLLLTVSNSNFDTFLKELVDTTTAERYLLWAEGNTYPAKDFLSGSGFTWNAKRKVWEVKAFKEAAGELAKLVSQNCKGVKIMYQRIN